MLVDIEDDKEPDDDDEEDDEIGNFCFDFSIYLQANTINELQIVTAINN